MPQRSPPQLCSTGVHQVPAIQHELYNPVTKKTIAASQSEIHEVIEHGASSPAALKRFLQEL